MKKIIIINLFFILLGCTSPNIQPWYAMPENLNELKITGNVNYHRGFYSPQLNNIRDIIVWLPPSYFNKTTKRYPVLYLHDGQNVFDPATSFLGVDWHLDEIVTKMIKNGEIQEIIMVGVNNTEDRVPEYSPIHKGKEYSEFLVETVKPYIDANYRTFANAKNTAVMGSSMGGLISFHLAWEYPHIFSMTGCLSPAFLVDDNEIVKRVNATQIMPEIKLVILNGSLGLEAELQPAVTDMVDTLKLKGFKNLKYQIIHGAEHNEAAWAKQVEIPLLYFFGNTNLK